MSRLGAGIFAGPDRLARVGEFGGQNAGKKIKGTRHEGQGRRMAGEHRLEPLHVISDDGRVVDQRGRGEDSERGSQVLASRPHCGVAVANRRPTRNSALGRLFRQRLVFARQDPDLGDLLRCRGRLARRRRGLIRQ